MIMTENPVLFIGNVVPVNGLLLLLILKEPSVVPDRTHFEEGEMETKPRELDKMILVVRNVMMKEPLVVPIRSAPLSHSGGPLECRTALYILVERKLVYISSHSLSIYTIQSEEN